jgi:diguanylate cyclase (GGDEF)-like protein
VWLRRQTLLTKAMLASAVPMVLLAVVLAQVGATKMRDRALGEAERAGVLVAQLGVQPQLRRVDVENGLSQARLAILRATLGVGVLREELAGLRIVNRDGMVVFDDDPDLIETRVSIGSDVRRALGGGVTSRVETRPSPVGGRDRVLQVASPLRFDPGEPAAGAVLLSVPYEPIARDIGRDQRSIYLTILAGFILLGAALFRIISSASRRLERQAEENRHLALHDGLTGLPNRRLIQERLEHAVHEARRSGKGVATVLLDLNRFKQINDSLGHGCGDRLLCVVAERLRRALRETDTVGRLGGDEFAVILRDVESREHAAELVQRIQAAGFDDPIEVDGLTIYVEAAIGVALFPDDAVDGEALLQRTDVAMYVSKTWHAGHAFYASSFDQHTQGRIALLSELHRALAEREIVLHFQPKVAVADETVVGVEALARWQHPERGLLPPSEFIPFAEETAVIRPLTLYVLDGALEQCASWRAQGIDVFVSVNLAPRNLLDADLPRDIAELLEKWRVPPRALQLEITEGTIVGDPVRVRQVIERLHELEVGLAIDDFGTGYSSLGYLKRLPVQTIKIDKSFVLDMTEDGDDEAIVRATIQLGKNLGMATVAEGVEDLATLRRLRELGCDFAQGFLFGRPMPASELTPLFAGLGIARERVA